MDARVALSVYSSREDIERLMQTVGHAQAAMAGTEGVIDLIINGNAALAQEAAARVRALPPAGKATPLRVWHIVFGDKCGAWNQYIHQIAPPAETYVMVDGYALANRNAVANLRSTLETHPEALAATGLPGNGRTAEAMARGIRADGGLIFCLHALRGDTVKEMRRIDFRLPLGMYRIDSALGAACAFGLNLRERRWAPRERVAVADDASWLAPPQRWWHPSDIRGQWKRLQRQAQGHLENAAIRSWLHLRAAPFEQLPRTLPELIQEWMGSYPEDAQRLLRRHRLSRRALPRMLEARDWSLAKQPPQCLVDQTQ